MIHPVWVGDFGKQNMSASSNLSAEAQVSVPTCTFGLLYLSASSAVLVILHCHPYL
jgi:hypothetical protein